MRNTNKILLATILTIATVLGTLSVSAQSRKPVKKTASVTYIRGLSSKLGGIIELEMNGEVKEFQWSAVAEPFKTASLPYSGKAIQRGAKWRIVYSYITPEMDTVGIGNYYFLWSAKFTGRVKK